MKSAQDKFNNYLDEYRETQTAVNTFTNGSHGFYGDYAFAAGYYGSLVADLISQLPKAKRAEYRDRLLREGKLFEQKVLIEKIKETA
jgi:hypothetical protein